MIGVPGAQPAAFDEIQRELEPVAVTRWTARLADSDVERSFVENRFLDDRRRVLVLLGFIAAAGALVVIGRFIAYLAGNGPLMAIFPPALPVVAASCGALLLLRLRSPQALETCLLVVGGIVVLTRFTILTVQPSMADNWLPLIVASLFVIYCYLPVRLMGAVMFAAFYSAVATTWWLSLSGAHLRPEQIYFGLLWVILGNGLGFTVANSLQRGQRIQYAQRLVMQQLLGTDALTGIANRRSLDEALALEWRRCGRSRRPLSLLMIDVDHFKAYNDRFGHQAGDACLRRVAHALTGCLGRPEHMVARYGGEEFVCLLPEIDQRGAAKFARRLAAAIDRIRLAHPDSPHGGRLTVSVGVATASEFFGNSSELVALADRLLYGAKNTGRNRMVTGELIADPRVARAA
jgi:diguanylate cyclase (GGDEF)-like protein